MKTIQINQMKEVIKEAPNSTNLLFIGDTGIGKTQGIQQYAKETGAYLKTLILSTLEPSECLGVPVQSKKFYNGKEYDVLSTAIPTWVFDLKEHEENAILFLDEFLCANPEVMNSFLNFLTEKKVQDIDLSKVKVVSATNIGDYTNELDENMLSRFCMFKVENDNFVDYLENKYNVSIIDSSYTCENENYVSNQIFNCRSLKPRCQEELLKAEQTLSNKKMLAWFYEGYTNRPMPARRPKRPLIFTKSTRYNKIIDSKLVYNENTNEYELNGCLSTYIAEDLRKYFENKKDYERLVNNVRKQINPELKDNIKQVVNSALDTIISKIAFANSEFSFNDGTTTEDFIF